MRVFRNRWSSLLRSHRTNVCPRYQQLQHECDHNLKPWLEHLTWLISPMFKMVLPLDFIISKTICLLIAFNFCWFQISSIGHCKSKEKAIKERMQWLLTWLFLLYQPLQNYYEWRMIVPPLQLDLVPCFHLHL